VSRERDQPAVGVAEADDDLVLVVVGRGQLGFELVEGAEDTVRHVRIVRLDREGKHLALRSIGRERVRLAVGTSLADEATAAARVSRRAGRRPSP
jgi:hypothetical protein